MTTRRIHISSSTHYAVDVRFSSSFRYARLPLGLTVVESRRKKRTENKRANGRAIIASLTRRVTVNRMGGSSSRGDGEEGRLLGPVVTINRWPGYRRCMCVCMCVVDEKKLLIALIECATATTTPCNSLPQIGLLIPYTSCSNFVGMFTTPPPRSRHLFRPIGRY